MDVPKTAQEEDYRITYDKAKLEVRVGRRRRWLHKLFGIGEEFTEEWLTVFDHAPVSQIRDYLEDREEDAWVRVTVL